MGRNEFQSKFSIYKHILLAFFTIYSAFGTKRKYYLPQIHQKGGKVFTAGMGVERKMEPSSKIREALSSVCASSDRPLGSS